jgi:endonuclease YncB( thermonuclease family)
MRIARLPLLLAGAASIIGGFGFAWKVRADSPRPIPAAVIFLSGDSWNDRGMTYRLYGVQACLRGTSISTNTGVKDCGDLSMVYLAGLVRLTKPSCLAVAQLERPPQFFVTCEAAIDGRAIDLGAALISAGFSFAATGPDGKAVSPTYAVMEASARQRRAGLWLSPDLPHPMVMLLYTLKQANTIPQ